MVYRKLDHKDLNAAIAHTEEAIQRALDLLKVVSRHPTIKGLSNVAELTPPLIEKLEQDLKEAREGAGKEFGRMNQLVLLVADRAPALIAAVGERASYRFFEFFTANIRNPHTRRAYARAAVEFFDWLAARGVRELAAIESVHVAAYIEQLQRRAPRRPRSCAWRRCGTCSTGWSSARSCR